MKNLIFFDTETTQKTNSRLVSLAFLIDCNGGPVQELFFKPAEPIAIEAMEVHGITEEQVKDCDPVNPEKLQPLFTDLIAVAHNAPFDIAVMAREGVKVGEFIDTLKVAQHLLPDFQAHRLQYLRYALDLNTGEESTAHDAKGDVEVLIELYKYLRNKLMTDLKINDYEAREKMLELTNKKVFLKKLPFGKFKDQLFSDVVKTVAGRDYFVWLMRQPDIAENIKDTIEHHLCS